MWSLGRRIRSKALKSYNFNHKVCITEVAPEIKSATYKYRNNEWLMIRVSSLLLSQ